MNHVVSEDGSAPGDPVYICIAESQLNAVMNNLESAQCLCRWLPSQLTTHCCGSSEIGGGMGLGLDIVHRSAALLGHEIDVASVPGIGSCLTVKVPLATSTASEPQW
jgi:hypothetical protein